MKIKYQVFVSSTFRDLQEERRQVIQVILELDCIPSGMELFPATNTDAWTLIESVITEADYYVLIIGGRYGSLDSEGVSYTEREYEIALKHKVPVLAFLHRDTGDIPSKNVDFDSEPRSKLCRFRTRIEAAHHVKYWKSAEELGGVVSRSLSLGIRTIRRNGWVSGEFSRTVEDLDKIIALENKVRLLEAENNALHLQRQNEDVTLSQGSDAIPIESGIFVDKNNQPAQSPATWDGILFHIAGTGVLDAHPESIATEIQRYVDSLTKASQKERCQLTLSGLNAIGRQYMALGLLCIESIPVTIPGAFTGETSRTSFVLRWRLTDRGRQYIVLDRAIRRNKECPN